MSGEPLHSIEAGHVFFAGALFSMAETVAGKDVAGVQKDPGQ